MTTPSNTINNILRQAAHKLDLSTSPRLDAEILLCHLLSCQRSYLYTWPQQVLTQQQLTDYHSLIEQRQQGQPIAYICGHKEFWSLMLAVNNNTLIPRPETECLVEWLIKQLPRDQTLEIADLGTGSGAIALALASECPNWQLTASDKDQATLDVAQQNAQQLKLNNVKFCHGLWCQALPHHRYDVIVSNPPYIAENDPHLEQAELRHEPQQALVAGADGLDDIRQIILLAPNYLNPGAHLVLEHGHDQSAAVLALLSSAGFEDCQSHQDLAGVSRFVTARKRTWIKPS